MAVHGTMSYMLHREVQREIRQKGKWGQIYEDVGSQRENWGPGPPRRRKPGRV